MGPNMRVADRINLIGKISSSLQSKYTFTEVDAFLLGYKIALPPETFNKNSKRLYAAEALQHVEDELLLRIANELDIQTPHSSIGLSPPRNWKNITRFRLFISHISAHKDKALRLRECLEPYAISGFVAHVDIEPTLEWQSEIERGLYAMDALIAIHTKGFSASNWTQQEIGFALGRGVKVISFRMGEDPTGFISKHQAVSRRQRSAEEIAKEIDALLCADIRTAEKLISAKNANATYLTDYDEIVF